MICPRCEERNATIHSKLFDVSLCEPCTRAIIEATASEKRREALELDAPKEEGKRWTPSTR